MKKTKIGIYGGTFSPPHIGHIRAAEAFYREILPDKLFIIPTFIPPHKDHSEQVSASDRLNMCELAFEHIPNTYISDIEIKRQGKSYTYLTLEELKSDENELYFLVGTDMLLTLDSWRFPEKIFDLATICFVRREDDGDKNTKIEEKIKLYREKYAARIIRIKNDAIEISSTELREKINSNGVLQKYIPSDVLEYITRGGLYS